MSRDPLQLIVGRAIIDSAFRQTLLGDPGAAIREYALPGEQARAVGAIRVRSLEEFAARVEQIRLRDRHAHRPPRPSPITGPLDRPLRAAV